MKVSIKLLCLIILFQVNVTFAESYSLRTDSHCKSRSVDLSFTCQRDTSSAPSILTVTRNIDNTWTGEEDGKKFPLTLLKEDKDILILNYPVLYSGIATVVIVQATGSFYLTEIAYSPALNVQRYDVESGRFVVIR